MTRAKGRRLGQGERHAPVPHPTDPEVCRCGLPMSAPNARHQPDPPATGWDDAADLDARRLGEREDD